MSKYFTFQISAGFVQKALLTTAAIGAFVYFVPNAVNIIERRKPGETRYDDKVYRFGATTMTITNKQNVTIDEDDARRLLQLIADVFDEGHTPFPETETDVERNIKLHDLKTCADELIRTKLI